MRQVCVPVPAFGWWGALLVPAFGRWGALPVPAFGRWDALRSHIHISFPPSEDTWLHMAQINIGRRSRDLKIFLI